MVGMDLIIGRFLSPLNSSKTVGSVRRRDDNSRGKVRKVRADSSADPRSPAEERANRGEIPERDQAAAIRQRALHDSRAYQTPS
jgi:hypothetical protein